MAVTANVLPEDRNACEAVVMDDFIRKPVRKQCFLAAVDHWLRPDEAVSPEPAPDVTSAQEFSPEAPLDDEPPFDLSVLHRLEYDVGEEVIPILLEGFEEDLYRQPKELQGLAEAGALETLMRVVHTIKGSAATFGAKRLSDAALAVETVGREGDLDGARALLPALFAAVEAAKPCVPKSL